MARVFWWQPRREAAPVKKKAVKRKAPAKRAAGGSG